MYVSMDYPQRNFKNNIIMKRKFKFNNIIMRRYHMIHQPGYDVQRPIHM